MTSTIGEVLLRMVQVMLMTTRKKKRRGKKRESQDPQFLSTLWRKILTRKERRDSTRSRRSSNHQQRRKRTQRPMLACGLSRPSIRRSMKAKTKVSKGLGEGAWWDFHQLEDLLTVMSLKSALKTHLKPLAKVMILNCKHNQFGIRINYSLMKRIHAREI